MLEEQNLSYLKLSDIMSTSPQIAKFTEESILELEMKLKTELSGKTIDINHMDSTSLFNILSTIVKNRGGTVEDANEKPEYKFGVFSDIHLYINSGDDMNVGQGNGVIDFTRGLSCLKNHGVSFACIAGDIGMNASTYVSTEMMYDIAIQSADIDFPISCCRGNHDTVITDEMWKLTTSCESNYAIEKNEKDLFVFISLPGHPELSASYQSYYDAEQPYSTSSIEFLSSTLESNPGKNVFLFMHFPLNSEKYNQYAGLGNYYYPSTSHGTYSGEINYYGFKLSGQKNAQNETFLDIIKNYDGKIIVFNGHSHYIFDNDIHTENIIFSKINDNAYSIHVPSLNFPRNRFAQTIMSSYPANQPSQGYVVERYKKYLTIKGYDFNALYDQKYGDLLRTYKIELI